MSVSSARRAEATLDDTAWPVVVVTFGDAMSAPARTEGLGDPPVEPAPTTPEEFAAFIRSEHARWGEVIRNAGIKLEQ